MVKREAVELNILCRGFEASAENKNFKKFDKFKKICYNIYRKLKKKNKIGGVA